jgi:IS5 family transposase
MFESIEEAVRLARLDQLGDPLRKLDSIDWDAFADIIRVEMNREAVAARGGPERYGDKLMFKILVVQRHNGLGDDAMEFLITDRSSYRRFLGLASDDKVPDAKTIHRYRDELAAKEGLIEKLLALFIRRLAEQGLVGREGVIIDGSFVEAPRRRNSREDNTTIKSGETPAEWKEPGKEAMLRQKDTDARWTKKNAQSHYGYKLHVKVDARSKLILTAACTDASTHDSQAVKALLDEGDRGKVAHADCAYRGPAVAALLAALDMTNRIHEQGVRGRPLTEAQKKSNTEKSRVRSRVEHVFGIIETQMGGSFTRLIGLRRNRFLCLLTALTHNIVRRFQIASPIGMRGRRMA